MAFPQKQLSIDDIVSLNPCDRYSLEDHKKNFAGRQTIDIYDVLAMDGPDLDKIWLIVEGKYLTDDQINQIKSVMLNIISDESSVHYTRQQAKPIYSYGPTCAHLVESGMEKQKSVQHIEFTIINAIKEMATQ